MISAFSWQNSVSLCPASFCTPRSNLPVITGISCFLLLHSNPLLWKGHHFLMLVLEGLKGLHKLFTLSFFGISGCRIDLDYFDAEWLPLERNWDHSVVIDVAPKHCILDSFIDYEGYSISSKGFLPTVVIIQWSTELNSPILVHLVYWLLRCWYSLLPSPVFQVQFTLIHGPNTPGSYAILFFTASEFTFTTRHIHNWALFPLWPSLFILSGGIFSTLTSGVLDTYQPGGSSSSVIPFCLFILFTGFSRQETGVVCHSLFRWVTFCQFSPPCLVCLGWPCTCMAHSFIELHKAQWSF